MGFKLVDAGWLLPGFVDYLEHHGCDHVTTELALAWAKLPVNTDPVWWRQRLNIVRGFAEYLHTIDPATEIPARDLLPARQHRIAPYIYSDSDIAALMAAARTLKPALRAATYETFIGLLSVTGLRLGEALALDRADLDRKRLLLHVRHAKRGNRIVPVRESTIQALDRYFAIVDGCRFPKPLSPSMFVSIRGTRMNKDSMHATFPGLIDRAGLTGRGQRARPRIHDLHLLVSRGVTRTFCHRRPPARTIPRRTLMSALAPTLQKFFADRLTTQRYASPATVAAYRDAFRLLLVFVADRKKIAPADLDFTDLDAPTIAAFLTYLETERHNSIRSRNARLAAIHSMFRFAALEHPEHAEVIARVLAIPQKRFERAIVSFLTKDEVQALLAAPDRDTWLGRRDHALLSLAIQTGLRVSELTGLRRGDLALSTGPHVRCHGKGRKQRATPLTTSTVTVLREWLAAHPGEPDSPLFPGL